MSTEIIWHIISHLMCRFVGPFPFLMRRFVCPFKQAYLADCIAVYYVMIFLFIRPAVGLAV